ASLEGYATVEQIEILKAEYKGSSKSISEATSVSITTDDTISRSNLKVGSNIVTLKGTVYLKSTLSPDDIYTKTITKEITINVEEKDDPYVNVYANTNPDSVQFNNADIPVTINVSSQLINYTTSSNIDRWVIYAKESTSTYYQSKTIAGSSLTSDTSFNFVIPASKVLDENYTEEYKVTAKVYLKDGTSFEALTYTSTYIYTSSDGQGTADIYCNDTVMAGDELFVVGVVTGLEGTISYDWETQNAYNVNLFNNQYGSIWYPVSAIGTNNIHLIASSNQGGYAFGFKSVTVTEPIPEAKISYTGTLKENRKVTISGEKSISPKYYPINWSIADWTITPITSGVTMDDIKLTDSNIDGKKSFDVLFKKPGTYQVSLNIINGAGYFDYVEIIYTVIADEVPVVDFTSVLTEYRDYDNYNHATIKLTNKSYSNDNDLLNRMIVYYKYDSDNDGSFADEINTVIYNNIYLDSYQFEVSEIGKYLINIRVIESFGQATIEEFILGTDYKRADTSIKPNTEKIVNVNNLAPIADLTLQQSDEVNLIIDLGDTDYSFDTIESHINSTLYPTLKDSNINVNYLIKDEEISSYSRIYNDVFSTTAFISLPDKSIVAWGNNSKGNAGTGDSNYLASFENSTFDFTEYPVKKISAGNSNTLALLENGRILWSGNDANSNVFKYVTGGETGTTYLENVKDIFVLVYNDPYNPYHASYYALLENGRVVSWGNNRYGRLGNGTATDAPTPVYVAGGETGTTYLGNVKQIVGRSSVGMSVLLENGRVVSWGRGFLGDGTTSSYTPVYVRGGETGTTYLGNVEKLYSSFGSGDLTTFALLTNGRVASWGAYLIGNGSTNTIAYTPVYVRGGETGTTYLGNIKDIKVAGSSAYALLENGRVASWGSNYYGQLGNTSYILTAYAPIYVSGGETGTIYLENVKEIYSEQESTFVLLENGRVVSWGGDNWSGQLGNGMNYGYPYSYSFIPRYVKGGETGNTYLENVFSIGISNRGTFFLTEEAVLYCGILMDNNNVPEYVPVDSSITEFEAVGRTPIELNVGLQNSNFLKNTNNFYVYINDSTIEDYYDSNKKLNILSSLQLNNVGFIGLGTDININEFNSLISLNNGNGLYKDNSDLTIAFNEITDYIYDLIIDKRNKISLDNYITTDENISFDTYYSDPENDPINQEIWRFNHVDPYYYENSIGIFPDSNVGLSIPITNFTYVGKYEITYKAQ
ncbi:MAG: RCC1 domain-containing protein, partial [Vulcanibacillus sp.]